MRLAFVCFLLLASVCQVSVCQAQVLIVSDQVPPPVTYPPEVDVMADAEFAKWAADYNKQQVAAMKERLSKLTEPKYIYGEETDTTRDFAGYGSPFNFDVNFGGRNDSYYIRPDMYRGTASRCSVSYPRRWLNINYVGPGPLNIVNPFVRPAK